MALEIKSIKGTADVLPSDSYKWQFVERLFLDTARLYGFGEIRIPTFEDKRLFIRSVAIPTDVVQKEMYTLYRPGRAGTRTSSGRYRRCQPCGD